MPTVSKSALKAKMLEYFRRVEETGEELIVTDHQRPTLRISPIRTRLSPKEAFSDVRGQVCYHEDVITPTTSEWQDV